MSVRWKFRNLMIKCFLIASRWACTRSLHKNCFNQRLIAVIKSLFWRAAYVDCLNFDFQKEFENFLHTRDWRYFSHSGILYFATDVMGDT